jgi:bacterioferritin-associated ferredoxin
MTEIVCRCEDITKEDILEAIEQGYTTLEEIKRVLRCGMGPCQGRTCTPLILRLLAQKTGKSVAELSIPTTRPPLQPLPIALFAGEEE